MNKQARRELQAQRVKIDGKAELFSIVIRATADPAVVDARTRSKWSRMLRFVAKFKRRHEPFEAFVKHMAGSTAVRHSLPLAWGEA